MASFSTFGFQYFPTVTNAIDHILSFAYNFLMTTNLTNNIRTFCNEHIAVYQMVIFAIFSNFIFPTVTNATDHILISSISL